MFKALAKIFSLAVLVGAGMFGILYYRDHTDEARHVAELQSENRQLEMVVDRLTDESRVADLLVTDQTTINGIVHTTLLFEEYGRDGHPLAPKSFTILGSEAHLDAMVIKFDRDFVKKNDPLRGHSLALFTRIYGNQQTPDSGPLIDTPGHIPEIYQGTNPKVTQFEMELWQKFWHLADDPKYRQEMGVRVPDGEGPWWPCSPEKLYTVTLEADGGLNVTSEPVKSIYREALREKTAG
jgi:hypothetical protein